MKDHPRIRKTVKWGGAVVTVLLVVLWVSSAFFYASWCQRNVRGGPEWWVDCCRGRIAFGRKKFHDSDLFVNPGFWARPAIDVRLDLGTERWVRAWDWYFAIPIWMPAVAVLVPTALVFRRDILARRRARIGLCPKCHYDRTGLAASAVCPECGTAPTT